MLSAVLLLLFPVWHPIAVWLLLLVGVELPLHALRPMMSVPFTVVSIFEMTVSFLAWMVYSLHLPCLKGLIWAASARVLDPIALGKLVNVLWNAFSAVSVSAEVSAITSVSRWSKLRVVIGSFLAPPLLLELLLVNDLHLADFSVLVLA